VCFHENTILISYDNLSGGIDILSELHMIGVINCGKSNEYFHFELDDVWRAL
jgi:hypothetical protein